MWVIWWIVGHMRWYAGHAATLQEAEAYADSLVKQGKRCVIEYAIVKEPVIT